MAMTHLGLRQSDRRCAAPPAPSSSPPCPPTIIRSALAWRESAGPSGGPKARHVRRRGGRPSPSARWRSRPQPPSASARGNSSVPQADVVGDPGGHDPGLRVALILAHRGHPQGPRDAGRRDRRPPGAVQPRPLLDSDIGDAPPPISSSLSLWKIICSRLSPTVAVFRGPGKSPAPGQTSSQYTPHMMQRQHVDVEHARAFLDGRCRSPAPRCGSPWADQTYWQR